MATHDDIRTRWHKVSELVEKRRVALNAATGSLDELERFAGPHRTKDRQFRLDPVQLVNLLEVVDPVPKFYLEGSLLEVMGRDDVVSSLKAMHEAKVMKLPFPVCLVEFDVRRDGQPCREMVVLSERGEGMRLPQEEVFHPYRANLLRVKRIPGEEDLLVLSPSTLFLAFVDDAELHDGLGGRGFGTHWFTTPAGYVHEESHRQQVKALRETNESDVRTADTALSAIVLLMNTRGVEKVVVEPTRLNRSRERSGKTPVPRHTVIRIGHVYAKDGTSQRVDPETGKLGRKPVRVHWRKGHTRNVRVGKGRVDTRLVYVDPVLVNYVGGDEPTYSARVGL